MTRWLADLGAEVLKVEHVDRGDYLRSIPPYLDGRSLMQTIGDRGKASLELDFGSTQGMRAIAALARVADVIVLGSRPSGAIRRGIDIEQLRRKHPNIIICSVTGFGLTGPLANIPAHGMTIDTLAGVADARFIDGRWKLTGGLGSTLGVELGALHAVIGILASVMDVRLGGSGSWLDISLWDAAVEANRINVALATRGMKERLEIGDQGPLYTVYECSDERLIMFGAVEHKFWSKFCIEVGRPDLVHRWGGRGDVGFGDDDSLATELTAIFLSRSSGQWAEFFRTNDLPCNIVLTVDEVVNHPHFFVRGLIQSQEGGPTTILNPILWVDSQKRLGENALPAPTLGEGGSDVATRWLETPGTSSTVEP